MPELPEVETIKRELEKQIVGKRVAEVCVHAPGIVKEPSVKDFKRAIEGASFVSVQRKAKLLILGLSNKMFLTVHLKMTGQLVYPGSGESSRVVFKFSDGTQMDFNDQRLFAELRLRRDWRDLPFIRGLGPEPFEISADEFSRMLSSKKTKIKPLLMDQTFISGIGNLYAAEALFSSRIDPQRPAASLTGNEKKALFTAIQTVLRDAIRHGGSSVDNYVRLSGKPGSYVTYHKVYGRQGKACLVCKTPVKRISLGGRGTYYCPQCQR
jgi:formamidopyrimidine-DNA glycosylase